VLPVTGDYLAWRVRGSLLPTVEAYGPCLLNDILPAFSNLEKRADAVADMEYARLGALPATDDFDGDMGVLAEQASDKGQAFYETMITMRQATLNLFSVGLFHLVEQKLTDLCNDASFPMDPPDTNLGAVRQWYARHLRLDLQLLRNWPTIEELRLLANAVKHAEGSTERQLHERQLLRERRPQLFEHPLTRRLGPDAPRIERPLRQPLAGEDLYVTDDLFGEYATAVVGFFQALAEHFDTHGKEQYPDL